MFSSGVQNMIMLKILQQDYEIIHSTTYNRLYRRKKVAPDAQLWKDIATLTFDMQPPDGESAPAYTVIYKDFDVQPPDGRGAAAHITVYKGTDYTDGRYGWLSKSIQDRFETGGGGFELKYWHTADTNAAQNVRNPLTEENPHFLLYQDNLFGEEDGIFRIALPNGTYEVTCYFRAGVVAPVEINLIANGEKRFQKLRLTTANEFAEKRYTVTITDERLTQVIYTREKRWAWSGFTVKRLSKGD